jgi:hypothetical protein
VPLEVIDSLDSDHIKEPSRFIGTSRRLAMRQGRCQGEWFSMKSTDDVQVRQSLPQLSQTYVGDLSVANDEFREFGQRS